MLLTYEEHQFLMKLMSQAFAYADAHDEPTKRRALALSIMDKLDINLLANGYADQAGELAE